MNSLKILRNLDRANKGIIYISKEKKREYVFSDKIVPNSIVTRGEALKEDMESFRQLMDKRNNFTDQ